MRTSTRHENDLWVEQKYIDKNGAFQSSVFAGDCYVEVRLEIWLHPHLTDDVRPHDEFVYNPHKTLYDGFLGRNGGGRPQEDAVLAHERGHAKAFFLHQKAAFEAKISSLRMKPRLTEDDKKKVEKAFDTSARETASFSIAYANENTMNWYKNHNYVVTEEGVLYVFKRK